ncbi:MAG: hypothetical protein RIB44_18125 [Lacipirellulaceae bacterium]
MPTHQQTTKWWWRFLATHNPFYVISALLTLYGLHISFRDNIDPTQGWLQLQLFIGYMSLLALTGILVVRFGQVWEDARTLFLLLLLLMVALSVSFDRVCLDDEYLGLRFLSVGLAASVALCEVLLRVVKVSLPWRYRAVLYLQLAILFSYPAWLGHLSLTDQLTPLAWWTMAFPTVVAGSLVLLIPAALSGATKVKENGTPWSWPLYPWTLFVILGIGLAIRSVSLTFSFDPTKGFTSGFQAYFLVPMLLAVMLLLAVSTVRRGDGRSWWRFVVAPLVLIALALPGAPQSVSQARYLELLQEALGSPVQITATLLLAYFVFLLVLGLRNAEWGILASLAVFSVVDRQTLGLNMLAEIQLAPATLALLLLAISAVARRSTARLALATVGLVGAATYALSETEFVADQYYVPIHLTTISLALVGFIYDDPLGQWIRRNISMFLGSVTVLSILAYRFLFPSHLIAWHALVALLFSGVIVIAWKKNHSLRDFLLLVLCVSISGCHLAEYYFGSHTILGYLPGRSWILWGTGFLMLGLLVSFAKGGQIRRWYRAIQQWHLAIEQPPNGP